MRKARQAAARRGRRLHIMFGDEAQFGRINRPRPCWAPIGIRPEVASQLIREYIYLYGAVSPKGRDLRLSDHADIEHGLLPGLVAPEKLHPPEWRLYFIGMVRQSLLGRENSLFFAENSLLDERLRRGGTWGSRS